MIQKRFFSLFLLLMTFPFSHIYSQTPVENGLATITTNSIQGPLKFLSSDNLEGREPGTKGCYIAADYIASLFKTFELAPGAENGSYHQSVDLIVTDNNGATHSIKIVTKDKNQISTTSFVNEIDFFAPPIFISLRIEGSILYCGYGLSEDKYNELNNIKSRGVVIVRIKGYPGQQDSLSKAFQYFSEKDRSKIMKNRSDKAKSLGVAAILEYDPEDPFLKIIEARRNSNITKAAGCEGKQHTHYSGIYTKSFRLQSEQKDDIPVYSISQTVMEKVFPNYTDLINATVKNTSDLKAQKPVTSNKRVEIEGVADVKKIESSNILAIIKGSEKPEEVIVVGAHYDHLGAYKGFIWNGADDNASGAIGMLTIARAFVATEVQPKRTVIFAAWTAEERGLLGSKYFMNSYPDAKNILYYHNYDMIGRSYDPSKPDSSVALLYTKSWEKAEGLVRAAVNDYDLGLKVNYSAWDNPVSGSDNATFAKRGIPIMWFHTGGHPEYHKPGDHYDKIDWQKMRDIIKVSFVTLWELANEE